MQNKTSLSPHKQNITVYLLPQLEVKKLFGKSFLSHYIQCSFAQVITCFLTQNVQSSFKGIVTNLQIKMPERITCQNNSSYSISKAVSVHVMETYRRSRGIAPPIDPGIR